MAGLNPKLVQALINKLATKGTAPLPSTPQERLLVPAVRSPKTGEISVGQRGDMHGDIADRMGIVDEFDRIDREHFEAGFVSPNGTFLDRDQSTRFLNDLGALKRHPEVVEDGELIAEDLFGIDISGDMKIDKFQETDLLNTILKILQDQQ
tara:strand:+ start:14 stop:466 length:453 start_codon:yes stop_codon:yes gene_type:complete